jgi:hypothetical protein
MIYMAQRRKRSVKEYKLGHAQHVLDRLCQIRLHRDSVFTSPWLGVWDLLVWSKDSKQNVFLVLGFE